jgi:hypothetical protein
MGLNSRITEIEEKVGGKAHVEIVCIYKGDTEAEEKRRAAIDNYREKYGCLNGLRIVNTNCPEPLPLLERFKRKPCQPSKSSFLPMI